MTSKELLENIIIDCEYYGKNKATIDKATIESIKKDLEVLEILKQKPQSELHLVLLGKFKTYNEYLKYTDTDRWGWEYANKVFSKKEFDLIKECLDNDK